MINTSKIVISGGPGGGKTTIINSLKDMGYYCYDEISKMLNFYTDQINKL